MTGHSSGVRQLDYRWSWPPASIHVEVRFDPDLMSAWQLELELQHALTALRRALIQEVSDDVRHNPTCN